MGYCCLIIPRLVRKIDIAPEIEIDIYNRSLLGPAANQYDIFMIKQIKMFLISDFTQNFHTNAIYIAQTYFFIMLLIFPVRELFL